MGIMTRVHELVSSNINATLDKAENPEKLVRLLLRDMEETLGEVKQACAETMASQKRTRRHLTEEQRQAERWHNRARLALEQHREDLAREALLERRGHMQRIEELERDLTQFDDLVDQYQSDIIAIEEKIVQARKRQQELAHARSEADRRRAVRHQRGPRAPQASFVRFEVFDQRLERLGRESDAVACPAKRSLREEFEELEVQEAIDLELAALREAVHNPVNTDSPIE